MGEMAESGLLRFPAKEEWVYPHRRFKSYSLRKAYCVLGRNMIC